MYRGVFGTLSSDQHISLHRQLFCTTVAESESRSLVSDSLRPCGLHCPWNSPGQSTGVDSLSLLQGSSQPRSPELQVDSLPAELQR